MLEKVFCAAIFNSSLCLQILHQFYVLNRIICRICEAASDNQKYLNAFHTLELPVIWIMHLGNGNVLVFFSVQRITHISMDVYFSSRWVTWFCLINNLLENLAVGKYHNTTAYPRLRKECHLTELLYQECSFTPSEKRSESENCLWYLLLILWSFCLFFDLFAWCEYALKDVHTQRYRDLFSITHDILNHQSCLHIRSLWCCGCRNQGSRSKTVGGFVWRIRYWCSTSEKCIPCCFHQSKLWTKSHGGTGRTKPLFKSPNSLISANLWCVSRGHIKDLLSNPFEFSPNVFTEFSNKHFFRYNIKGSNLLPLCVRDQDASVRKTSVRDRIFKLTSSHSSMIYQIPWIHWISVPFREKTHCLVT